MIDVLLAALTEYLSAKKDHVAGQLTIEELAAAKKRCAEALNEYVDFRVQAVLDERRKHISQERIQIADNINSTIKNSAAVVRSVTALNSAPPPPMAIDDPKKMAEWRKQYAEWYENQRKKGISVG